MARRPKEYIVHVTHRSVHNPEAYQRGLELWATYLAENLSKPQAGGVRADRDDADA
ncbi:MAG: hypothetical protein K0R39_5070 [Symbiobacteriaceae bacterium]|jgi:hypothetical protein|nr:hypothetical protein [Symbiobacteriaceae bacterium]